MQKIFKVYLIRDKHTLDIMYVGLTRQTLDTRFKAHIYEKKLVRTKYQIELIYDELTIEQAVILEKMLIKQYDLLNKGWNKSPGSIDGGSQYHSEEQKQKWRNERPGKPVSPDHANKNKMARLGKKNTPEHIDAIKKHTCKKVMCIETGITFNSAREAAKQMNLQYSKISLVCNEKRTTTGGYHFKFIETVETNGND